MKTGLYRFQTFLKSLPMFKSRRKWLTQLHENHGQIKKEAFDFRQIRKYFSFSRDRTSYQSISDRTLEDLDLEELFMLIDRTTTRPGQQFLYHTIRSIPRDNIKTDKFEKIIEWLEQNPDKLKALLPDLSVLDHKDAYYIPSLFAEKHIQKPKWFPAIQLLSLASIGSALFAFIFPQLLIALLLLLTVNFSIHYWNKSNLYQYSASIPQLLALNTLIKKITATGYTKEIHPDILKSSLAIDGLGFRMKIFKLEARLQSEIGQAVEYLAELIKALFLIEPLVLFNVLEELESRKEHVRNLFEFIGDFDVAISISALRKTLPYYCKPGDTAHEKQIHGSDIYHPLIFSAVGNSITLSQKSALLTGSNMSGKTTFIRTIGINAITGQTLNTCFAKEFAMPRMKVFSAIRITDDLLNDKSYYFEEVLAIRNLLNESESEFPCLFLLDELFKGTNTIERIASGKAVLSYLSKGENIVLAATHDQELADLLAGPFNLFHFTEAFQGDQIVFDYKIKSGKLLTTNAIRILELNGYPTELTAEAKALATHLNKLK